MKSAKNLNRVAQEVIETLQDNGHKESYICDWEVRLKELPDDNLTVLHYLMGRLDDENTSRLAERLEVTTDELWGAMSVASAIEGNDARIRRGTVISTKEQGLKI